MIRITSPFGKTIACTSVFSLLLCMVPSTVLASFAKSAKDMMPKPKPQPAASKVLSASRMKAIQGRVGENPYAAGQSKWDVVYKGVNLMNGNYSTSGTDLTFEGGYGIPVNVTRSYSANNGEEGPLGKGWTLSVDVRSTAGGIMKSSSAPVRAVPVNFKERPSTQVDPNVVTADGSDVQPLEAILSTDSGGNEETIQRDADGILSTPPWDKNKIESEYETIIKTDGTNVRIMTKNWVHTPEGTVYVYEKKGAYINGSRPFNNSSAAAEDSNVLKIVSATDRHGNATTYTYDTVAGHEVTFQKLNGSVSEAPLTKIHMPNGHEINFTWSDVDSSSVVTKRITSATDGVRTVTYGYSTSGLLTSVTTPAGKVTSYGYSATTLHGPNTSGVYSPYALTSITDPRGLTTTIYNCMSDSFGYVDGLGVTGERISTYRISNPDDSNTWFVIDNLRSSSSSPYTISLNTIVPLVAEYAGSRKLHETYVNAVTSPTTGVSVELRDLAYSTSDDNIVKPTNIKNYDFATQDLLEELNYTGSYIDTREVYPSYKAAERKLFFERHFKNRTTTTYNFMGAPLSKSSYEYSDVSSAYNLDRTTTVAYAYWGAEKYYQQKAVKDQAGRYSYTDYYNSSATQGKKGQTYKVYDDKRTTFVENTGIAIPVSVPPCPSGNYWKYRLEPQTDTYSAKFDYDSNGRPVDVWKIQKTTTTPWTYVQTRTEYGANSTPIWGAAVKVTEDYGGIGRVTETLEYDSIGRAIKVKDASGKEFKTYYNLDGVIDSIQRVDSGLTQDVVTYTYGTTGITNGAVLSVTDNLSGVSQSRSYYSSGNAIGQIQSISETNGSDSYSSTYTYLAGGLRDTVTYVTQAALSMPSTVKWKYADYTSVGSDPLNRNQVFQTLVRLDSSTGYATGEEFHYAYAQSGVMQEATYAMTAQSWSPSSGASYYDSSHLAATRARSHYEYDSGGRLKGVYNWWDTLSSGNYTSEFIRGNESDYEVTGSNRGLKTTSRYLIPVSGTPSSWQTQRTETYGYDADLDYLTSSTYGDGLPNASVTWGYDAAGNRTSDSVNTGTWTYDNLNRMTASPGVSYANDILGNRTAKGTTDYQWDILNRMTGVGTLSGSILSGWQYNYRADGLRVEKVHNPIAEVGGTVEQVKYRYDGQMGIEDVEIDGLGAVKTLTRYGLGGRGVDVVSRTTSSGNVVTYPLYDGHGNNVGALSKSGSSFTVGEEKSYDAWGGLRSGTNANGKATYCANLGHKQDDESGLIYMRARYYESTSGRFVSEDRKRDGFNWFRYGANNPISKIDPSGLSVLLDIEFSMQGAESEAAMMSIGQVAKGKAIQMVLYLETKYAAMGLAIAGYGTSRAGEAAVRFTTSLGNTVVFRFNQAENLLKFNTNGPKYGVPHHQQLTNFVQEMMEWACENGI